MHAVPVYALLAITLIVGYWEGRPHVGKIPGSNDQTRSSIWSFAAMSGKDVMGYCPMQDRKIGACDQYTDLADGRVALCLSRPENLARLNESCRRWLLTTLSNAPRACIAEFEADCPGKWGVLRRTGCFQKRRAESPYCQAWQASVRNIVESL